MNRFLKLCWIAVILFTSFINKKEMFSLTVEVNGLRNSKGDVQFALYNKKSSIPDEKFKNSYKIIKGKIINDSSEVTFDHLPAGKYAVSILHDEDGNGKIKKVIFLPKEGIGFSNYQSISLANRPSFKKASFDLNNNLTINVKIIYL